MFPIPTDHLLAGVRQYCVLDDVTTQRFHEILHVPDFIHTNLTGGPESGAAHWSCYKSSGGQERERERERESERERERDRERDREREEGKESKEMKGESIHVCIKGWLHAEA